MYEGISYPINTDYREILVIMSAFEDNKLGDWDKLIVLWDLIFTYEDKIPMMTNESLSLVMDFLNAGLKVSDTGTTQRVYSWETDSSYIINAISKMVHYSIRDIEYLHWHDFIGFFSEIGESTFATIVGIRQKKQSVTTGISTVTAQAEIQLDQEVNTIIQNLNNFLQQTNTMNNKYVSMNLKEQRMYVVTVTSAVVIVAIFLIITK